MAIKKVLILKGLPASGKSTYANQLLANKRDNWVRFNKDTARLQYFNSEWSKPRENFVVEMRDAAITFAMIRGYNIIIDDTNFAPQHEQEVRKIVDFWNNNTASTSLEPQDKYEVEVKFFNVNVDECVRRNDQRNKKLRAAGLPILVRGSIIWDMYNKYVKGNYPELEYVKPEEEPAPVYTPPKDKPKCILVDLDGTLAHMTTRKGRPFEWHRVGEDALDETVAQIVRTYYDLGHSNWADDDPEPKVIILSGRDGICRSETEQWLSDNKIRYDKLLMRKIGDNRKDSITKCEIFEAEIRDNYQVMFVLDDRNQVVEMWRGLGLKVLQVAEGDF